MKTILLALFFVGFTAQSQTRDYANFHEIDKGKFYRSAQLSAGDLEAYVKQYGIRTVINLRGENPGEEWFQNEESISQRLGLEFVSIAMSASKIPSRTNLNTLLTAFATLPRPILVHCRAGADRTGEASALYQMLYMNKTKDQALKMLTPRYGHFKFIMPAKRYFIDEVWQGVEWAQNQYEPCSGNYKYYDANGSECR